MFWLALAAATAAPSPQGGQPVVVSQATATVRIVSGVRLKLDSAVNADAPTAHDIKVTTTDGTQHPARLIEFQ